MDKLYNILDNVDEVYYNDSVNPSLNKTIARNLAHIKIRSPTSQIQHLRLYKSAAEKELMRRSTAASGQAFAATMAHTEPGMLESALEARFELEVKMRGAQRMAYPPVFAAGINANTLHYISNDMVMRDGDLILVDAGGERDMYPSDITRTWPVNGKFSSAQEEVYEMILQVQKTCIERSVADGRTSLDSVHTQAMKLFYDALYKKNLVSSTHEVRRFFPHSIGHWLGMDIHDTPDVHTAMPFRADMMCTIEPGLYFPDTPDVPERYRGIGIRIEDNIIIGPGGAPAEVITHHAPKQIADIEAACQSKSPPHHT
eukprot:TRINITY_DN10298_c0_g1_i3.p1 TRINITY_DN10298_c0_g1~~TRINITY_DN10298_c0_g1_i3.p1  ORF type:complete len:314 (-),score=49.79 TRINITY_DN10298_c0_g1_i3:3-944(-)